MINVALVHRKQENASSLLLTQVKSCWGIGGGGGGGGGIKACLPPLMKISMHLIPPHLIPPVRTVWDPEKTLRCKFSSLDQDDAY